MHDLYMLFYVLSLICLGLAVLNPGPVKLYQLNMGMLGVFFFVLVPTIAYART